MDLEPLEMITEDTLREVVEPEIVSRAYLDLANGKVIHRTRFPGGSIYARWDAQPNSPEMQLGFQDDLLLTLCSCRPFRQDGTCDHIAALLVAWVSQRETFAGAPMGGGAVVERYDRARTEAPLAPAAGRQAPTGQKLDVVDDFRQMLSRFKVDDLREIARRRSVTISGIRKEPIVDSLAQAFAQREKFRQDWQMLSLPARRVAGLLPFLVYYSNAASLEQAAKPLGIKGPAFEQAIDELTAFGMIAVENYGVIHYPAVLPVWAPPDADFLDIPAYEPGAQRVQPAPPPRAFYQAVTRLLILIQSASNQYPVRVDVQTRDLWKKVPVLRDWPVETQDLEQAARDPRPYQFVQQHGLRIAPVPSPLTNEARQKLAEALRTAPEETDFILRLLHTLGLVLLKPGRPMRAVDRAISAVLQVDALQQVRQMFTVYADLPVWSEIDLALARAGDFQLILRNYNQGNYDLFLQNMSVLRERLLLLIRRLPPERWYAVRDLARAASQFPFYPLLRGIAGFGYFEASGRKLNMDRAEDGQELLARLIEAMLFGPLYWQGAVDLAWETGPAGVERVAGFRLTEMGSALLAHPTAFEMPKPAVETTALQFTPDGDLELQLESASGTLVGLAVLLGDIEVSPGGAVRARPTLAGAGRAFAAGWTAERMLETLEAEAGRQAPQSLAERLGKWWQDYGRVQIYQDIALIEFNDDYALSELLAGTSLSRYLLYRFSPRLIAIRPEGAEEMRLELIKKGYTPKTAA